MYTDYPEIEMRIALRNYNNLLTTIRTYYCVRAYLPADLPTDSGPTGQFTLSSRDTPNSGSLRHSPTHLLYIIETA